MERIFKRTFAVILVAVMLLSVAPMGEIADWFAARAAAASYQYIQYGNYPQSRETNSSVISTLNAKAGSISTWNSYGYYSGTGSWNDGQMTAKDYMKYKDVVVGGVKYRGVYFSSYRPYLTGYRNSDGTYQDDNGYYTGKSYWFRYEPLTWRVLDSSTGLVLCENIIDSQAYNNYILYSSNEYYGNASKTYYANNYYYSSIRKWLNDDFYNTTFTDTQKKNIETTHLNNNCYSSSYPQYNAPASDDKVFLLSYDEERNSSYGFSSSAATYDTARRAQGTDYAKCQGLWVSTSSSYYGNSWWWLRSPYHNSRYACGVNFDGYSGHRNYVSSADGGVRPALKLSHLKSDISQSGISSSNSGSAVSANINSIRITPREANASIKLNGANIASKDISFALKSVTAEVGGKTFTQNSDKIIEIPTKDVTGDITIKKSGYDDYVIPREVYNSFTTASLDNILDYEAYMTQSRQDGKVYVSSVFGRVSGSGDSYVDLTKNSMKITPDTSYDFYVTARNTSSSATYAITQDDSHKISPRSSGVFTLSDIGDKLTNGKTAYVYVTSGGTRSDLVPIRLNVENNVENAFVKQLKSGTLALGGSDGLTIKVPESWVLIGGSELNIADFNFPVGVNITGNKVRVSVGFDLWNKTTTESTSKCAVDTETQQQIDRNTYIKEQQSGVITDGMWKTVKSGIKDAEWSWKNATTNADKLKVKRNLADRYGLSIGDLSSSNKKTTGFNVSALGYIEGEIVGGKFVMTDFLISCSGSFTISYTHQMAVGYIGVEGGGKLTVSFNAARNVADTTVDFDLETGIQVTPTITPRAGLGWDGVACIGVYGTASMPMGLTFSFVDKSLTASLQIDGEIGYEAKLLIFKTGRKPLISGTVGPWTHTWNFGSRMSVNLYETVNPELFANCKSNSYVNADVTLELTERTNPSSWLSEPDFSTSSVITETGVTIEDLQTDVFANSGAKIVTCGNTTMAVWTADDTARDEYNRLELVYSVYNNATETWSEPKAVYDDGHMDASPSLATDGKNIYVAWQKFVKTFDSTNSTELSDLMECAEIYTAKYDAQADAFVSATRITNDSVYDYAPSVVVKDGTANVFYATNANNALLSIDGNKISKYAGGNTTVLKSDLAAINGLESAIVNSDIQIAFSTDTDGNLETTNDIALFYGLDTFNAVPNVIENVQSSVLNFTYADIDGETKLLYSDGMNIYYESEGKAKAILDEGATVSGQISAVKSGDVTNLFWLSSTDSGNELYTASYENGNWSDAVALTNRGNKFSNVALTYANNTLLGVANETLTTYDEATSTYKDGETNLVSIKLNDFVDLKADGMDIIEYDRAEGEMTGINVSVLNNGNVSLDRLYFDITDSNGYSKTYYIDTELLPGKTELCLLPYEIPTNFADTTVSVKVYSESYTDINEDDNTVSYKPENADLLASNLPVTYFKDGCIITTEIANYSFTNAKKVVATVSFEEGGEEKGVNYIGTLDNDSLISVDFAYAFDELTFDEDGIAKIYLTVTADNAQSTTLTYLVEKNETVCAHPITESADDIAPTCTEEGHKAGVRCLGCGEYISGGEAIPATGHTAVVDKAVAPTCTKTGLTEGSHCSVCGEVITAQEEVPMTEHTDSNGDAKCDACGISMSDILPGETKTVEITGGSITYLKFVPTVSGNYSFTSVSSSDTYGYLYDADKNQITYNDDGGSGSNFLISYDLIKGTTYYFGCRYYSTSTSGSFDVTLTLNSALETLTPTENTTTVIDTLNGYIYGINPRMDNPLDYFSINSGYDCDMNGSSTLPDGNSCYGTGSIFTVKSGDTVVAKYSLIIFGDVNGDGWYDGQDAITVSCLANGMLTREQVGEAVWMAADCNHDGVIDQLDVDLLNQAGVLLSSVDQTKPTGELIETSAEYNEYLGLIDQMGSEDTTETPTQDESDSFFTRIIALIESIVKLINTIFTKIF